MPTPTFERLRPEKQQRIVGAARHEFAERGFASASLDRIALSAGIPKGSIYQYFEDKEGFYEDVMRDALDETWRRFEEHVEAEPPADCFDLFAKAMSFMLILAESDPDLARIFHRVVFSPDGPRKAELHGRYEHRSEAFYERLFSTGLAAGQIDPEADPELIRFVLAATGQRFQQRVLSGNAHTLPTQGNPSQLANSIAESLRRAFAPRPGSRRRSARSGISTRPAEACASKDGGHPPRRGRRRGRGRGEGDGGTR